jgi:hypothetical protein
MTGSGVDQELQEWNPPSSPITDFAAVSGPSNTVTACRGYMYTELNQQGCPHQAYGDPPQRKYSAPQQQCSTSPASQYGAPQGQSGRSASLGNQYGAPPAGLHVAPPNTTPNTMIGRNTVVDIRNIASKATHNPANNMILQRYLHQVRPLQSRLRQRRLNRSQQLTVWATAWGRGLG